MPNFTKILSLFVLMNSAMAFCFFRAQDKNRIDSLELEYKKAKTSTQKIDISRELFNTQINYSFKDALKYLRLHLELSDSLSRLENNQELERLETEYQTKQKENDILLLSALNEQSFRV